MAPPGGLHVGKAPGEGAAQPGHTSPGKGSGVPKSSATILPPVKVRLPKAFSPSAFGHGGAKKVHPELGAQSPTAGQNAVTFDLSPSRKTSHEEKSGLALGGLQKLPSLKIEGSNRARLSIEEGSQSPTSFGPPPLPASPTSAAPPKVEVEPKLGYDPFNTGSFPPRPATWLLFTKGKSGQEGGQREANVGDAENGAAPNGAHAQLELFDDPSQDFVHPAVYIRQVRGSLTALADLICREGCMGSFYSPTTFCGTMYWEGCSK